MSWDPTLTLANLKQTLAATKAFPGGVQIGEPFSAPADLVAAIAFLDWEPAEATLSTTIDTVTLLVRIYARAGMTPVDAGSVETKVAKAVSVTLAALAGAFTVGNTVRAISFVGEGGGKRVTIKFGHLVLDGTIFRMVDFNVPLIVDDSATWVA